MKRLVGGLFLLNLTAISLGLTAGEVSISDEEVLSQLLELRNFIDDKRDFTKGFKDLKPVLVQYRSSASKIDGVVPCNLSFNTDALHLSIAGYSVQADGTPITLRINVVYEWTDYVGYTIKTAKLEATKNFVVDSIPYENIVDKNGHKRFIEGDIDLNESADSDLTKMYGKWSLSGSHLLIVLSVSCIDKTLSYQSRLANINLPEWIQNKIYVVIEGGNYVRGINITFYDSSNNIQTTQAQLRKDENGLFISMSAITLSTEKATVIAFDLLIDNA